VPNLKYQKEVDEMDCDFKGFVERERVAFRWTFENIDDQRNFLPRFLLQPKRERNDCIGWGLSFYTTQEAAKKRLIDIVGYRKNLYKKLGDHVAKGNLIKNDGLSDKEQDNGHFTHFEYEKIDLTLTFNVVEKIQ